MRSPVEMEGAEKIEHPSGIDLRFTDKMVTVRLFGTNPLQIGIENLDQVGYRLIGQGVEIGIDGGLWKHPCHLVT